MRIEFDDDDFGGFTVTDGELTEVPYGWKEVSPGRFEPTWPPCRYRRLSKRSIQGRVTILPNCLLLEKPVTFDTCASCDRMKPPLEYKEMTPDVLAAIKSRKIEEFEHALAEFDPVFLPEPEVTTDPWIPCKHRFEQQTDCCTKHKCGNEQCPRHNKNVKKRHCKNCEFRED